MLVTVTARLVRSHGKDEIPLPGSGQIEYRPESHGTFQGALRGMDAVVSKIANGEAEPVELTPGQWRVSVDPGHGPAWRSWLIEITEGMDEPVDLADLAPAIVVDGEKWAVGPAGASVTGAVDNGDQTVSFTLSDGTETAPVSIPPGPAGVGVASISDPDADSRVTVTYTDGSTSTVQAIRGAKGDPGKKGDPGEDSTVPGPAGPPGQVLTPESMLVVGPGRPDAPTTTGMTSEALAALPVGCEYRSTDGASVGAWVWRKRPSGEWEVTDGDTGWRVFSFAPAPWNGTVSVRVRRVGTTVYMEPHTPSTNGVWRLGSLDATGVGPTTIAFTLGDAFRPANRVVVQIVSGADAGSGEQLGRVLVDGTNGQVRVKHPANNALAMTAMWPTAQPWPATLPGDPIS